MNRSHYSFIVIGKPNSGKTSLVRHILNNYPKDKKVLIYNVNGEFFDGYKSVTSMDIAEGKFNKGVYSPKNATSKTAINNFVNAIEKINRVNGIVFIDDATKIFGYGMDMQFRSLLAGRGQKNMDLIFCFHSMLSVPNFICDLTENYIIFASNSEVKTSKIPTQVKRACNVINKNNIPFVFYSFNIYQDKGSYQILKDGKIQNLQ